MKHLLLISLFLLMSVFTAKSITKSNTVQTNDDVILHAWSWSFNTIRENMKDIADAGYKFVQTSPAQQCVTETKGDKGGGMQLFGKGRWYYYYQPTDWKIGNYMLGSRDDFKAMCDEAKKYGIRIIVDVLPNHTSIDDTRVSDDLDAAVGGHDNLYHANGFIEIKDYNDRLQCTTGQMGGLPDVNTENPDFQYYYMTYVNDLINCGASGFRYDTAKHIGLPSDPLDSKSKENDFWQVAMGQKPVKGLKLVVPRDSLFIYGEVLQDKNVKEKEYAEFFDLTASSYGHILRNILSAKNFKADNATNWAHSVSPDRLVTWVESHDTYCNAHESASLTNEQIRVAWVFLTSRQYGTPLFYSRPDGSTPDNVWGNNVAGAKGNNEFKHPEVIAVNKFRRAMSGQQETLYFNDNSTVAQVARGQKGVSLVNISDKEEIIEMPTTLRNGTYYDQVYNTKFIVKKGILRGSLKPYTSYILIRK